VAAVVESSGLGAKIACDSDSVWVDIARSYAAFSSPLVPSIEDIRIYEEAVACHVAGIEREHFDALMLGVTPGIANMKWPRGSRILALDMSPTVIRALWPGDVPGFREARPASWSAPPVEKGSLDIVVGDGSLNACRHPAEIRAVCSAVYSVLRRGGIFVLRAYVQRLHGESIEQVFDDLLGSTGLKVDEFKMRLWLAMQRSSHEGVSVRDAARLLEEFGVTGAVMRHRLCWTDAAIEPFEKWKTSDAVYSFPSLAELRNVLIDHFVEVSTTFPPYALGDNCPVVIMRSSESEARNGRV
jgi:hypothetical protein